jgi:hypothetical protein
VRLHADIQSRIRVFFRVLYLVPAWIVSATFLWQSNRDTSSLTISEWTVKPGSSNARVDASPH